MRRNCWLLLLFLPPLCAAKVTDRYDVYINEACNLYLEGMDCDWFKALLYTESLLKPDARSHVGARGIAQVMPGTWDDVAEKVEGAIDPYDARASIRVGAFILKRYTNFWDPHRKDYERMLLGFASYNAGPGNILKAQRQCTGARSWRDISPCLPTVTGHHSTETINYVDRIKDNFCKIKKQSNRGIWSLDYMRDNCRRLLVGPIPKQKSGLKSLARAG